jgi:hypothetical protein
MVAHCEIKDAVQGYALTVTKDTDRLTFSDAGLDRKGTLNHRDGYDW